MEFKLNSVLIIDGSYMLHRSLKTPDLWELKNKDGVRTGGVFGFLKSLGVSLRIGDYFPVICWDGGHSARRLTVYPNYKRHMEKNLLREADQFALMLLNKEITSLPENLDISMREAIEESLAHFNEVKERYGSYVDPDDYSSQYLRQRDLIISICHSLGVPSILISHWEGDDLITILSRISRQSMIVTDDKDMYQLLSPNTAIYRAMAKQHLVYEQFLPAQNVISSREFVVQKAISGDPSDNIPSVTDNETERKYRVGEATASKIAKVVVACNEDSKKYFEELLQITDRDRNKIQGFLRNHNNYEKNMQLVDLSLVENDAQVIDTMIAEIRLKAGKAKLFEVLSKLGEMDIASIDVNGLVSRITALQRVLFI